MKLGLFEKSLVINLKLCKHFKNVIKKIQTSFFSQELINESQNKWNRDGWQKCKLVESQV